jgi:3-hydroxyisobutyrate dehydrogenase
MKVGYVGLGNMGSALAARLQLTHPLKVYDVNDAVLKQLTDLGATRCSALTELASHCDVVMLCLPTSDHVRTAIFGDGGLLGGLSKGALIIDQSSGDPGATRAMVAELTKREIDLIDAPVSGGTDGAAAGTIAIMVGATPEQFARAQPVLTAISSNIFHAGGPGAGHVIKLVNNMVSGAQRLLSLEALSLAAKNGIDPRTACEILVAGGGKNVYLDKYVSQRLLTGKLKLGFSLELMHKDLRLACQLATDSGVPLFFGNLAKEYYQLCISHMGQAANVQSAALVVDRLAGTHVVPSIHDLN